MSTFINATLFLRAKVLNLRHEASDAVYSSYDEAVAAVVWDSSGQIIGWAAQEVRGAVCGKVVDGTYRHS